MMSSSGRDRRGDSTGIDIRRRGGRPENLGTRDIRRSLRDSPRRRVRLYALLRRLSTARADTSSPTPRATAPSSHFRLRFMQPVRHAHLAVHRRRGGEMLPGLLALVRAPVEFAEAEVAVAVILVHAAGYARPAIARHPHDPPIDLGV